MEEIAFLLNNLKFNWNTIEGIAVFFSIIYVVLAAKKNLYCWLAAVISVTLYVYICFSAKLYAETILQIFYLFMAFYGYYNWNKDEQSLQIIELDIRVHLIIISFGAVLTFLIGFLLTTYTDAKLPIIDSFTTIFSIFATYMIAKKILENWLYWIVIDIISCYIYFNRELHLTCLLFIIYTIIAIIGYLNWLNITRKDD